MTSQQADQIQASAQGVVDNRPVEEKLRNFAAIKPEVCGIVEFFEDVVKIDLERLPARAFREIYQLASQTADRLKNITVYAPGVQQFSQLERDIPNNIPRLYDECMKIWPVISFQLSRAESLRRFEEETRSKLQKLEERAGAALMDAESALDTARSVTAESAIAKTATFFESEATLYAHQSGRWLVASVGLAIMACYALWLALRLDAVNMEIKSAAAAQLIASRIVAVSLFSFGLIWGTRNYRPLVTIKWSTGIGTMRWPRSEHSLTLRRVIRRPRMQYYSKPPARSFSHNQPATAKTRTSHSRAPRLSRYSADW
jgi:hypothetical protein